MFHTAMGKIVTGIVLALVGLVAMILLDPEVFGEIGILVAWALLLLGVLFVASGVLQMITSSVASDGGQTRPGTLTERDYIIRTTLAMALADGRLDDKEVRSTAAIYKELTGKEIGIDQVRALATTMKGGAAGIFAELKEAQSRLSEATKLLIVKAAYLSLAADGEVTSEEEGRIGDVAQSLGLPYEQAIGAIREADKQATVLRTGKGRKA